MVKMGIKRILSGLLGFGKSREAEQSGLQTDKSTHQIEEVASPFAKFMQPDMLVAPQPRLPTDADDVFLLEKAEDKLLDTVGLYFPEQSALLVRDPYLGKVGQLTRCFEGVAQITPLVGDWFGSGKVTLGFYNPTHGLFCFPKDGESQESTFKFLFGPANCGWIPLVGDWYGQGRSGIGVYDPNTGLYLLHGDLTPENAEIGFHYGAQRRGWVPLVGDWNGDGKDGIGLYDPVKGQFLLRNSLSEGDPDYVFNFGEISKSRCQPFVGDWNGDGRDGVGLYDPAEGLFQLRNLLTSGAPEIRFRFGPRGVSAKPIGLPWKRACS